VAAAILLNSHGGWAFSPIPGRLGIAINVGLQLSVFALAAGVIVFAAGFRSSERRKFVSLLAQNGRFGPWARRERADGVLNSTVTR
jgi:hypothetical protein